jgi:hypothetical protein
MLHNTSAPRSISVIDDLTIINQNYPKAGIEGTLRCASADFTVYKFTYLPVERAATFLTLAPPIFLPL